MYADGASGSIAGEDYTVDYTIIDYSFSQITINAQNHNAGFSNGVSGSGSADFIITTDPITTSFGDISLRANLGMANLNDDVYVQRIVLDEIEGDLFAQVYLASNSADV